MKVSLWLVLILVLSGLSLCSYRFIMGHNYHYGPMLASEKLSQWWGLDLSADDVIDDYQIEKGLDPIRSFRLKGTHAADLAVSELNKRSECKVVQDLNAISSALSQRLVYFPDTWDLARATPIWHCSLSNADGVLEIYRLTDATYVIVFMAL